MKKLQYHLVDDLALFIVQLAHGAAGQVDPEFDAFPETQLPDLSFLDEQRGLFTVIYDFF